MQKNYLTYPLKKMRITQSYSGTVSHKPHTLGTPKDYPVDDGGADSGRDYMYCPCDEMVIRRIYGVGGGGTNTLWLQSTDVVHFADGTKDFFTLLVTHPNDSDLKKLKVGQRFKRGEKICREGADGATGNHFHFSGGKGLFKGNGWVQNSKGKWVLYVTTKAEKPENLFFIDKSFTKIVNSKGLWFEPLPTEKNKKTYAAGNYKVTKANLLYIREKPSTKAKKKQFNELSESARKKILSISGKKANGYVKGLTFSVLKVQDNWGQTPSGWVCLDYCEVLR